MMEANGGCFRVLLCRDLPSYIAPGPVVLWRSSDLGWAFVESFETFLGTPTHKKFISIFVYE